MRQCRLYRHLPEGRQTQVAWLPEKFAEVGRILKLKDNDVWEDGWVVSSIGTALVSDEIITERSQDYKNTRKASDV